MLIQEHAIGGLADPSPPHSRLFKHAISRLADCSPPPSLIQVLPLLTLVRTTVDSPLPYTNASGGTGESQRALWPGLPPSTARHTNLCRKYMQEGGMHQRGKFKGSCMLLLVYKAVLHVDCNHIAACQVLGSGVDGRRHVQRCWIPLHPAGLVSVLLLCSECARPAL